MALYHCYGHYQAPASPLLPTWSWLSRPRFLPLSIVVFSGMVALVAIAMIAISMANLRRGLVQVEIECASQTFDCVLSDLLNRRIRKYSSYKRRSAARPNDTVVWDPTRHYRLTQPDGTTVDIAVPLDVRLFDLAPARNIRMALVSTTCIRGTELMYIRALPSGIGPFRQDRLR